MDLYVCVYLGFHEYVTLLVSMCLCTCAGGYLHIYLCCGGMCYVCGGWVFFHVSEYMYVHGYVLAMCFSEYF